MKKNTLAALILTTLAAGQLASLQAHAAGQLNVWEDIKKSAGIKTAVSDFEKQYNVKVNLQEMPYAQQLEKLRLDGPAGIGPDVLVIPNDQLGGAVVQGLLSPLSVDQAKQDAFTPASINAFRMDNALYGIPKAVENPGAYLQQGPDRQAAGQPAGLAGLLENPARAEQIRPARQV
ncbi:Cyclodextrin-binding protein precursor [Serratia liquefaciens]|nr:Cyclodextrin-binding protein precursor [Serratia liquefaciens]